MVFRVGILWVIGCVATQEMGSNGILFLPKGNLHLGGDSYVFPVIIPFKELIEPLRNMELKMANLKTLIQRHEVPTDFFQIFTLAVDRVSSKVESQRSKLNYFISSLQGQMPTNKRSIGTLVGGSISRILLGQAADTLIKQLRKKFLKRRMSPADIKESSIHPVVFNETLKRIQYLESAQDMFTKTLNMSHRIVRRASLQATTALDGLMINTVILHFHLIVEDITNTISTVIEGLEDIILRGKCNNKIISKNMLLYIISKLPSWKEPWFPQLPAFTLYLSQSITIIPDLSESDKLTLYLQLPLKTDPIITFNLFEVITMPVPVSELVYAQVTNLSPYLAVSQDGHHHITLKELNSCLKMGKSHYCDFYVAPSRLAAPSCEFLSFRNLTDDTFCHKTLSNTFSPKFIRHEEKWFYSTPINTTFSIQCPDKARITKNIGAGIGTLALPVACAGYSDYTTLPSHSSLIHDTNLLLTLTPSHQDAFTSSTLEAINLNLLSTSPSVWNSPGRTVTLNELLLTEMNNNSAKQLASFPVVLVLFGGFVLMVCFILTVSYRYCRRTTLPTSRCRCLTFQSGSRLPQQALAAPERLRGLSLPEGGVLLESPEPSTSTETKNNQRRIVSTKTTTTRLLARSRVTPGSTGSERGVLCDKTPVSASATYE